MTARTMKSDAVRLQWRTVIEAARAGRDTIVKHYNTPTAVVIPFEDYEAILDELDDIRAARRAEAILEEIERDPSLVQDYDDARAELIAAGALDE